MKKVVALMLVLVMALSLCACGGSNLKKVLTSGTWVDVEYGDGYEFYKNGKGVYIYRTGAKEPITWSKLDSNSIRIEATHVLGMQVFDDYELIGGEGNYYLALDGQADNDRNFVLIR